MGKNSQMHNLKVLKKILHSPKGKKPLTKQNCLSPFPPSKKKQKKNKKQIKWSIPYEILRQPKTIFVCSTFIPGYYDVCTCHHPTIYHLCSSRLP